MSVRILVGHALDRLRELPDESVHCVVTSPPYYGLRDYKIEPQVWGGEARCAHEWGDDSIRGGSAQKQGASSQRAGRANVDEQSGQSNSQGAFCRRCGAWRGSLGLEPRLDLYLDHMVEVFREVRRVMRRDATCWLNMGDSYCAAQGGRQAAIGELPKDGKTRFATSKAKQRKDVDVTGWAHGVHGKRVTLPANSGLKPKDLMMVPARLAIRLCDDGWWVRSDIAWCKRAPMPESVTDRPTSAWEHVFLLTKGARYFYDAEAVKEDSVSESQSGSGFDQWNKKHIANSPMTGGTAPQKPWDDLGGKRNMRNFWVLGPEPFAEAHFATYPTEIPRRAILSGSKPGGTILDPFLGSGTTALVADRLGRDCIGIELNPEYATMARRRVEDDAGLFAEVAD